MISRQISSQNQAFILIAAGFEEEPVVQCLSQMRQAGLGVSLVGLSAGLISSLHGLVILPDYSLEQRLSKCSPLLLIVPGGQQSVSTLLADPRTYKLLESTFSHGGFVAATVTAQPILAEAGIPTASNACHFLAQNALEMSDYIKQLIHLMIGLDHKQTTSKKN